jgi:hypothetical protein
VIIDLLAIPFETLYEASLLGDISESSFFAFKVFLPWSLVVIALEQGRRAET